MSSAKFIGLAIAGGIVIGGLTFNGTEALNKVTKQLVELKAKVIAYEENENSLLSKISFIKSDATSKINSSNDKIASLTQQNNDLTNRINVLNATIRDLQGQITALIESGTNQGQMIKTLREQLELANNELSVLRLKLTETETQLAKVSEESASYKSEAERANKEIEKANEAVEALEKVANEVHNETKDLSPLSKEELDAITTTIGQ